MVQSIELHVRGFFSVASACEAPRGAGVQRHRCTLAGLHGVIRAARNACNQASWSRSTTLHVISRNRLRGNSEKKGISSIPAVERKKGSREERGREIGSEKRGDRREKSILLRDLIYANS